MSSRARRTSSSRSILFSTSSITRWNLMFTSVSASRPSAPIHHHLRCTTTTPYTPVLLLQGDLSADVAPWPVSLEAALDRVQEFQRGAAVEDAVVEGDLHVHHAAYGDGVVYHDGTFDDSFRGENRCLRVVDNGRGDHASQRARVVHGECATRDVFG